MHLPTMEYCWLKNFAISNISILTWWSLFLTIYLFKVASIILVNFLQSQTRLKPGFCKMPTDQVSTPPVMLFNVHTSVPVWLRNVGIVCHIPFMAQGKRVQHSPAMEFGAKLPNSLEDDLPSTRPFSGFFQEPRHNTFRIFWFSTFQEVAAKQ